jgi:hypothetical protein
MKNLGIALSGALVMAIAGAVLYASAAPTAATGTTLTGCLNKGGELKSVAVGNAPDKACGKNETLVHLGDGDITDVNAGTGLQGGADSGAASLAIAPSFRLPQGCTSNEAATWAGSAWACKDPLAGLSVSQLAANDANCPTGGVSISVRGVASYACNGAVGATGPTGAQGTQGPTGPSGSQGPAGTFSDAASPNGVFSVSLTNSGIVLHGPQGDVVVDYEGAKVETVEAPS